MDEPLTHDQRAMVEQNIGLVRTVLTDQAVGRDEYDDRFQDGCLGLCRAVQLHDPSKGKFSSYAYQWIRQAVQRGRERDQECWSTGTGESPGEDDPTGDEAVANVRAPALVEAWNRQQVRRDRRAAEARRVYRQAKAKGTLGVYGKGLKGKADRLFSQYIRARDGRCVACCGTDDLQCAHIVSRRYNATRCDPGNAVALCRSCHMGFTNDPLGWVRWVDDTFGAKFHDLLYKRARVVTRGTDSFWQARIDELTAALEDVA